MATTRKPAKRTAAKAKAKVKVKAKTKSTFSAAERAAMRERTREARRGRAGTGDGETEVLAKIAKMAPADRDLARRVHDLVRAAAPDLAPRLWYGMPAYAKDGKVVCFFQDAGKFKTRYATLGFSDQAALDEGAMWPSAFAITRLGPAEERRIRDLVRRAAG